MRRLVFVSIFITCIASLTSCKKDWSCDCTVQENTTTTVMANMKKKDAKKSCEDLSDILSTVSGSCELK